MRKITNLLVLMLFPLCFMAQKVDDRSNDMIYFCNECEISNLYVVDNSFLNHFSNYKSFFTETTNPAVGNVMVHTDGIMSIRDKDYYPIWVIKDNVLYLANIKAYDYLGGEGTFQKAALSKMEEYTGQKFDTPFSSPDESKISSTKLMKASWVTGTYYINQMRGKEGRPWHKIEIKDGVVIDLESAETAAKFNSVRQDPPLTRAQIDSLTELSRLGKVKRN